MNKDAGSTTLDAPTHFWWVRLPLALRWGSATFMIALLDGHYITAYPRISPFASPFALVLGLVVGWLHLGFDLVPTEALWLVVALVVIGTLSAHLGTLFLVGFAVGDFVLATHEAFNVRGVFQQSTLVRLPLIIEYALLGILLISIPLMTKGLLAQLVPSPRLGRHIRFIIAVVGHAALTFGLVFLWTQTVPILIRPVFTWVGNQPTTQAIVPLQQYGHLIALAALPASVGRLVLQVRTAIHVRLRTRPDAVERHVQAAAPVLPYTQRLPRRIRAVGHTVWSTLLLAGMFQSWPAALLLGTVILLLQLARAGVVSVPLGAWPRVAARLPLMLRLIAGSIIVFLLSRLVVGQAQLRSESFAPFVLLTGIALIVLFLLTPPLPGLEQQRGDKR